MLKTTSDISSQEDGICHSLFMCMLQLNDVSVDFKVVTSMISPFYIVMCYIRCVLALEACVTEQTVGFSATPCGHSPQGV